MKSHTPGEWIVSHSNDYFTGGATVVRGNAPHTGIVLAVCTKVEAEHANARLIAAAPELLEAARSLLVLLDNNDYYNDRVIDAARAAIAKAGNEP